MNRLQIKGRLDRHTYRLWSLGLALCVFLTYGALVLLRYSVVGGEMRLEGTWTLVFSILVIPEILIGILISMKRCQDINLMPWWGLTIVLPYVGLAAWFYLYMKPGTLGRNRFGDGVLSLPRVANRR